MDKHTRTLQQELNERWLSLDIVSKELLVMVARMFTDHKASYDGLPNYKRSVEEADKRMAEQYTTFGELEVGDRFTFFGHVYRKIEPDTIPLLVNCQSDRGQQYMGDGTAVGKVESQAR